MHESGVLLVEPPPPLICVEVLVSDPPLEAEVAAVAVVLESDVLDEVGVVEDEESDASELDADVDESELALVL